MYAVISFIAIIVILIIVVLILVLCKPRQQSGPLTFIHIPKNAGTSITNIARNNGFDWRHHEEGGVCSSWHIPPTIKSDKPSFCVIRNPYTRILSQCAYKMSKDDDLNTYITKKLKNFSDNNHLDDCHYIPQVEYVKYVDHILHFENLESEFNTLMKRYNLDISLDHNDNISKCKYVVENISRENILLINKIYHDDFIKLGYDKITFKDSSLS